MPMVYLTLLIAAVLPIIIAASTHIFKIKQFGKIDNNHPRIQLAKLEGIGARAYAAQLNAWEALAMYTAAVFVAYAMAVDMNSLALPASVFLIARLLHPVAYLMNLGFIRSAIWAVGFFATVYIAYLAF